MSRRLKFNMNTKLYIMLDYYNVDSSLFVDSECLGFVNCHSVKELEYWSDHFHNLFNNRERCYNGVNYRTEVHFRKIDVL